MAGGSSYLGYISYMSCMSYMGYSRTRPPQCRLATREDSPKCELPWQAVKPATGSFGRIVEVPLTA